MTRQGKKARSRRRRRHRKEQRRAIEEKPLVSPRNKRARKKGTCGRVRGVGPRRRVSRGRVVRRRRGGVDVLAAIVAVGDADDHVVAADGGGSDCRDGEEDKGEERDAGGEHGWQW
jgi:hypothetical protein